VVEDDCVSAEILKNMLRTFGYDVTVVTDGRQALERVRTGKFRMVVSDWEMPEMSGLDLCRQIRNRKWGGYVYFILVISFDDADHLVAGLQAGADECVTKPYRPDELRLRLRTGERILALESRDLMVFTLAKLAESRDIQTGMHLDRMREYCRVLADELSGWEQFKDEVDGDFVELLYLTCPLHDIGKVGIPDSVLLKPGPLSGEEFEIMKMHTTIGGETLAAATKAHPEAEFLVMAREIAMTHHERFDGEGYPHRLKGEDIPLCGRITALADVYDALTSKRVYKASFSHETARQIIVDGSGTQFDPNVVEAFLRREDSFIAIAQNLDGSMIDKDAPTLPMAELAELAEAAYAAE
jgi:putative two-component system response regulator